MDGRRDDAPAGLRPGAGDALVVVDLQCDFLPGGSLAVPGGDRVVPVLQACATRFARAGLPVFATRDWHPEDHCSFVAQGGPWPPHCVAATPGAAFPDGFVPPSAATVVSKGTRRERDAYSGFEGTDLGSRLREAGVRRVFVGGLATDYCVQATVLDARAAGFDVVVLADAIAAVDVAPGDGARAIARMREAGATIVASGALAD